jgi:hypothetical protein
MKGCLMIDINFVQTWINPRLTTIDLNRAIPRLCGGQRLIGRLDFSLTANHAGDAALKAAE